MTAESQTQFSNLIYTLAHGSGIDGFQGLNVNSDGSVLLIERQRCRLFSDIGGLVDWVAAQQTATPQPQISHATSNAS